MKKLLFTLFILIAFSCGSQDLQLVQLTVTINDTTILVEVADTSDSRALGLMHRRSLPANNGMLFVFPDEAIRSFWMHNTYIPLSIAYIDRDGRIRSIHDMTPLSRATIQSTLPVMYALEVNQGFFERHNITVGDRVIIPAGVRAVN
ncbi:MAG: DUF192 domain-containing protein [Spirochaetaceae bacterium]|nr:DUF192 domain-containing protein [Spirochaetaceae bacterium]